LGGSLPYSSYVLNPQITRLLQPKLFFGCTAQGQAQLTGPKSPVRNERGDTPKINARVHRYRSITGKKALMTIWAAMKTIP
jgi:hypothetical protein